MDIKKKPRSKLNIFLFSVIILALIGLAVFTSYYFLVYLRPNFNDENFNYIKKISPDEIKPGSEIQIELAFKNTGVREVKDFTAEFFMPQHTEFKISDQQGKYFKGKNSIVFESSSLKKGEGKKILITLLADKPLDNGTIIKFKDADINYRVSNKETASKIKNEAVCKIKSSPKITLSDLLLKDSNGGDINIGDVIIFGFNAKNAGDMNGTGVEASALIPPKTSVIESSVLPDNYKIEGDKIIWRLNIFEINKPVDFTFKLKVLNGYTDGEKIRESVNLKSNQGDNLASEAIGEVRLFPDLGNSKITLTDENGELTWAGDRISVKVLIINDGERSAQDVKFTCPIPKDTTYIKDSAKCEGAKISAEKGVLVFGIDTVGVGEKKEASFELQISPKMTGGGTVKTDFTLNSNGIEFEFPNTQLKVKANYQVTIACLGDSLVALSNWPQILDSLLESTFIHADYNVIASGIKGEMASGGFSRFDSTIAKYKPQIIVVGYGTNDIGSGTDRFSYYLNGIVGKARNISATVFLESLGFINIAMEPEKSDWPKYQRVIYQVGAGNGVPVVDIYTPLSQNPGAYTVDWVHYTPEGSSVVAHTIFNYIVQYLDSDGKRK